MVALKAKVDEARSVVNRSQQLIDLEQSIINAQLNAINAANSAIDSLSGSITSLSLPDTQMRNQWNTLNSQRNGLIDQWNGLNNRRNAIIDRIPKIVRWILVPPGVNELINAANSLLNQMNGLMNQINGLVGTMNDLVNRINSSTNHIRELIQQREQTIRGRAVAFGTKSAADVAKANAIAQKRLAQAALDTAQAAFDSAQNLLEQAKLPKPGQWKPEKLTLIVNGSEYLTWTVGERLRQGHSFWKGILGQTDLPPTEQFVKGLRVQKNVVLDGFHPEMALTTEIKKLGISGWKDGPVGYATVIGVLRNKPSPGTDVNVSLDLEVEQAETVGTNYILDGAHGVRHPRFIRIEYMLDKGDLRFAGWNVGDRFKVSGVVRRDTDGMGFYEIHPSNPTQIVRLEAAQARPGRPGRAGHESGKSIEEMVKKELPFSGGTATMAMKSARDLKAPLVKPASNTAMPRLLPLNAAQDKRLPRLIPVTPPPKY